MRVKALVKKEKIHSFKTRKGEEIKQVQLTCIDMSDHADEVFENFFDVTLDILPDEYAKRPSIINKVVEIALIGCSQIFAGKARFNGFLVDKSVKV